jgi:HD-GYP domain-containing protein (c-di-GMP phosphodiesterase class II)
MTLLSASVVSNLDGLARLMAVRDGATHKHSQRVQQLAFSLAKAAHVGDDRMRHAIAAAAMVHDVGKLAIPDRLLQKPGPLTPAECAHVKQHAAIGADLLSAIAFPGPLAPIVRAHHENWDGSGYPSGLAGTDIPVGARVLSIADCYDALTSDRPYRDAFTHESAVAMIRERRGTMFDAAIADVFMRIVDRLRAVHALEHRDKTRRVACVEALVRQEVGAV